MAHMADQPDTSSPAAGTAPAQRGRARRGAWGTGLAALGLAAVVAGLVAGVGSVSGAARPPDLGGPILAPGVAATPAPTVTSSPPARALTASPAARRPGRLPPQAFVQADGTRAPRARAATPVPVRALPVTPEPSVAPQPAAAAQQPPMASVAPGSAPSPVPSAPGAGSAP
jgi:hypothetical protein